VTDPGLFRVLAGLIVLLHVAFVLFVAGGGLLALRWPRAIWLHLPALAWGVVIEWAGWICPLTPLENALRRRGGQAEYQGDFIERYILPLLYPVELTRGRQVFLGALVLAVNGLVYWWVFRRRRRTSVVP
jgi:hypothetical protein